MENQKAANLLDTTFDSVPRFITKNEQKVLINQEKNYSVSKETRIKTAMFRSDLWDFSDAYIVDAYKNYKTKNHGDSFVKLLCTDC